ncbi:nuclear transport factor 2 family protein [Sneathiella marina]|uniref:Nuclear transport factor 2 family protein n=1 Tax=Sneathiella marina TaxID=2950108 RepID=A0ABY4W722_9PROT|nr:nuclear transport factor 2 family protein [Sneathiella marina]USG62641.1 nuclear transport factor 2 family protein [Sneathiella marina]
MTTSTLQSRAELSDLVDRFVDAFNRQNMEDVMSFFSEQAVYKDATGKSHEGKAAISKAFEPVLDGTLGKISFNGDDRFIDDATGKVMDSWTLHMFRGEGADKERSMIGLDLLHFENGKLVRKITYKRG